jgi:hypothetical protein
MNHVPMNPAHERVELRSRSGTHTQSQENNYHVIRPVEPACQTVFDIEI